MIQSILLRTLRKSEFIRFNKDVLSIANKQNPAALGIATQVAALQASVNPLDDLFVKERGNLITPELQTLDARRDAALIGIRLSAEAATYHYDPELISASRQILLAFDKYGHNLTKLNYIAETEVIISLADDLNSDAELRTAVNALDLSDWVKELSAANTAFNERYLARNTDYATRPDGNFIIQRELVIDAWQQLAGHITAHATLTPSAAYTQLIKEINTLIDQYNQLINNRSGGGEEEQAGDTPAAPDQAS